MRQEIKKELQIIESSGESDAEDLKNRWEIFREQQHEQRKFKDDRLTAADWIVEIKNHVQMVMEKFKLKSRKVVAGLRAEINYEIAVKSNDVSC